MIAPGLLVRDGRWSLCRKSGNIYILTGASAVDQVKVALDWVVGEPQLVLQCPQEL